MQLRPEGHRIVDFVIVAAFALAPTVLGLTDSPAVIAYTLAAIHLALTLATRFPGGGGRPVSIGLHAVLELLVGISLLIMPWLTDWPGDAQAFFSVAGLMMLAGWVLTNYTERKPRGARRESRKPAGR